MWAATTHYCQTFGHFQIQVHRRERRVRVEPANPQLRDLLNLPYSSPTSLLVPTTSFHNVHVTCESIENQDVIIEQLHDEFDCRLVSCNTMLAIRR